MIFRFDGRLLPIQTPLFSNMNDCAIDDDDDADSVSFIYYYSIHYMVSYRISSFLALSYSCSMIRTVLHRTVPHGAILAV